MSERNDLRNRCPPRIEKAPRPASFQIGILLVIATLGSGCATQRSNESWSYTVRLTSTNPPRILVEAEFVGNDPAFRGFATPDKRAMPFIDDLRIEPAAGLILAPDRRLPDHFRLTEPTRNTRLSYTVDLGKMASQVRDLKVAAQAGAAVFAPWTSWLLQPDGTRDAQVELTYVSEVADGAIVFAADPGESGEVQAHSDDLGRRIYAVFGDLNVDRVAVKRSNRPSAELAVVAPRGEFRLRRDELSKWVHENARLLGSFAGGFPVDHVLIVLAPIPGGGGPAFGRLQPSPVPTLLAFTGRDSTAADLRDDWILVHELIHMVFPPVSRKDRWIDEGIATYFEPILRARAGRVSETAMWGELVNGLPRGLRALEEQSLNNGRGINDVYWGGALFCFFADVEIRRRTQGARGLEDGIRALLQVGYSVTGPMRPVDLLLPIMDDAIGRDTDSDDVLARLWHRYVVDKNDAPLAETLASLGVISTGTGVRLNDDAPLAAIRRAIVWGSGTASDRGLSQSWTRRPSSADTYAE